MGFWTCTMSDHLNIIVYMVINQYHGIAMLIWYGAIHSIYNKGLIFKMQIRRLFHIIKNTVNIVTNNNAVTHSQQNKCTPANGLLTCCCYATVIVLWSVWLCWRLCSEPLSHVHFQGHYRGVTSVRGHSAHPVLLGHVALPGSCLVY